MWEVFELLLSKRGLSVADVSKATGIAPSTFSNWKRRNNKLSAKNATIIARFFEVSVDYLMTGIEHYTSQETADTAQELFEKPGMRVLFDAAKDSKPEDLRLAAELLKRLKETNRDT